MYVRVQLPHPHVYKGSPASALHTLTQKLLLSHYKCISASLCTFEHLSLSASPCRLSSCAHSKLPWSVSTSACSDTVGSIGSREAWSWISDHSPWCWSCCACGPHTKFITSVCSGWAGQGPCFCLDLYPLNPLHLSLSCVCVCVISLSS